MVEFLSDHIGKQRIPTAQRLVAPVNDARIETADPQPFAHLHGSKAGTDDDNVAAAGFSDMSFDPRGVHQALELENGRS